MVILFYSAGVLITYRQIRHLWLGWSDVRGDWAKSHTIGNVSPRHQLKGASSPHKVVFPVHVPPKILSLILFLLVYILHYLYFSLLTCTLELGCFHHTFHSEMIFPFAVYITLFCQNIQEILAFHLKKKRRFIYVLAFVFKQLVNFIVFIL